MTLPPVPASHTPQTLAVKGKRATLELTNILVGDVWILGGQSNMEFPISRVDDGLPDAGGAFSGPLCDAADDLLHAQGDPAEASTAAALAWLESGTCPAPPMAAKLAAPAPPDEYPAPERPTPAQVHLPGLF